MSDSSINRVAENLDNLKTDYLPQRDINRCIKEVLQGVYEELTILRQRINALTNYRDEKFW